MLHQSAPQRFEFRRVTLALPLMPGRHPSRADKFSRASTASGVAVADTDVTRAFTGASSVASRSRRARAPGWIRLPPAPRSEIRTSTESNSPTWSTVSPLATQRPTRSSGRRVMTIPPPNARSRRASTLWRRPASLAKAAGWSEIPPLTKLGGPITRELEREDFDLPVRN